MSGLAHVAGTHDKSVAFCPQCRFPNYTVFSASDCEISAELLLPKSRLTVTHFSEKCVVLVGEPAGTRRRGPARGPGGNREMTSAEVYLGRLAVMSGWGEVDVRNRDVAPRMRSSEASKIIRACICFVGRIAWSKCNFTARGLRGKAQRRLSKKLTVVQLVKILRTLTRRFVAVFTTAFHWALSCRTCLNINWNISD
jgi:hypothetical protein